MSSPLVQITDQLGQTTGLADMLDAFDQELIRRTVYVMLTDATGRYLLQKRAETVPNYPGFWDASAGGHVDEGEEPAVAAYRELAEELGITNAQLVLQDEFYYQSPVESGRSYRYYAHVYSAQLVDGQQVNPDQSEVADIGYYSAQEISQLAMVTPITLRALESL